jgi:hypothetical protein
MVILSQIKMRLDEADSRVCIGKHLSDTYSIQNGLKQVDDVWTSNFNSALKYSTRNVREM